LDGVFALLLMLGGFVLHTPRTDLFSKGKSRKVTTTLDAVRHEEYPEYNPARMFS
jgi:hypothetical protein